MAINYFEMNATKSAGTTGTGFDQLVDFVKNDIQLSQSISTADMQEGLDAANGILGMIAEAIRETGAGSSGKFLAEDVGKINAYVRENHYEEFVKLHGDDGAEGETGFHKVQLDGALSTYGVRGKNSLVNDVLDSLLHIGFEVKDGVLVNEDGDANASLERMANIMNDFFIDRSNTGTGLDALTDAILGDRRLAWKVSDEDRYEGAEAANGINGLILEAMATTGAGENGKVTADDVRAINAWIRENKLEAFTALHGDDENGVETGFHKVQGDSAFSKIFGQNLVDTVADGIYHIGFEIEGDSFLNEDGAANASVQDVADYLTYFLSGQGSTGTGLDKLVQILKSDRGLAARTSAADINAGAEAADGLNHLIAEAIQTQGLDRDGVLNIEDVKAINAYIRENHYERFLELRGNDEDGVETGFHLVQGDGGKILNDATPGRCNSYSGDSIIDMVMDGLYHIGFEIKDDKLLNEDGVAMNKLGNIASWLNEFYMGQEVKFGTQSDDVMRGLNTADTLFGREGNDRMLGKAGNDHLDGGAGDDALMGGAGNDTVFGGTGNDKLQGGGDADVLIDGEGRDKSFGEDGDDVFLSRADGERDFFYGGNGADTFMFWVDGQMSSDTIHYFRGATEGDKIVLGGEVANFTLHRAKRGFTDIRLWDADGNSLGKLRAAGVTKDMVEIDQTAFAEYQSELLLTGVDVAAELEALGLGSALVEDVIAEQAPALDVASDLVTLAAPAELDIDQSALTAAVF